MQANSLRRRRVRILPVHLRRCKHDSVQTGLVRVMSKLKWVVRRNHKSQALKHDIPWQFNSGRLKGSGEKAFGYSDEITKFWDQINGDWSPAVSYSVGV